MKSIKKLKGRECMNNLHVSRKINEIIDIMESNGLVEIEPSENDG